MRDRGVVSNRPVYGTRIVSNADATTAKSKNLFEVNPTLNAFLRSDRQFQTTINSLSVACTKAIVRALGRAERSPPPQI